MFAFLRLIPRAACLGLSAMGVAFGFAFIVLSAPSFASAPTDVLEQIGVLSAFSLFLAMAAVPDLLKSRNRKMTTFKTDFFAITSALLAALLLVALANVVSSGFPSSVSTMYLVTASALMVFASTSLAAIAGALVWLVPALFSEGAKELRWNGLM